MAENKQCTQAVANVPHKKHKFGPNNEWQCWGVVAPPKPKPQRSWKR